MGIEAKLRADDIECYLKDVRRRNQKKILEGRDGGGFQYYDSSLDRYEDTFEGILYPDSIASICQQTFSRQGHCHILDLCGQGSWITEIPKASGVAVALGFCPGKLTVPNAHNVRRMPGDILAPITWEKLRDYGPFDFVLCSPQGGSRSLWGQYPEILHEVIDNVLRLMSDQATFIIESLFESETYYKYIERDLSGQLQNVNIKAFNNKIRIDKMSK